MAAFQSLRLPPVLRSELAAWRDTVGHEVDFVRVRRLEITVGSMPGPS